MAPAGAEKGGIAVEARVRYARKTGRAAQAAKTVSHVIRDLTMTADVALCPLSAVILLATEVKDFILVFPIAMSCVVPVAPL